MICDIDKQGLAAVDQAEAVTLHPEVQLTAVSQILKLLSQKPLAFEGLNEERRLALLADIARFEQERDLPLDNNPPARPIGFRNSKVIDLRPDYKSKSINQVEIDCRIAIPSKDQIENLALGAQISLSVPIKDSNTFTVAQNTSSHMNLDDDHEAIQLVKGGLQPSMIGKNWRAIWGKEKTSRDILQNFFDGHNGTLEGVKIGILRDHSSGAYKGLITGMGQYDYEKAYLLGGTSKDQDPTKAGNFGEGLKVLALNLLRDFGADYVLMASDNWKMTYTMPDQQVGEPKMFRHLEAVALQNSGNYLEFTTTSVDLLEQIFKSLNYFYHPYNPDFSGTLVSSEYGGIAIFADPKQSGNIYLARQRFAYEKENNWEGTIPSMSIWTNEKSIDKGRDRTAVTESELLLVTENILNGLDDRDLVYLLKSLEWHWTNSDSNLGKFIEQIIDVLATRKISIPFDSKYYAGDANSINHDVSSVLLGSGHKILPRAFYRIGATPVEDWYKYFANFKMIEPTASEKFRIQILHKLMLDFMRELGEDANSLFDQQDLLKPIYIYDQGIQNGPDKFVQGRARYDAIWLGNNLLASSLSDVFNVYAHELMHKYGDDGSGGFTDAYQKYLPQILQMLTSVSFVRLFKEAECLWNQSLNQENQLSAAVAEVRDLFSGDYYQQSTLVKDRLALYFDYANKAVAYATQEVAEPAPSYYNDRRSYFGSFYEEMYDRSETPQDVKNFLSTRKLAKLPARYKPNHQIIPITSPTYTLLTMSEILNLQEAQSHLVAIEPTHAENVKPKIPKVNPYMDLSPGSTAEAMVAAGLQPSEIAERYQANWSIQKVCRDILQNFFDGHTQTLEGVKIEILVQQKNESSQKLFKVKIYGLAQYDFEKAYVLGASDKQDDNNNAGGYGEGLKMIALNLLRDYGVEYVQAASANWLMTYLLPNTTASNKTSKLYNILNYIPDSANQPVGNYLEFATSQPELVEALLNATTYFYHPYNPDFQEASYENQLGGFKLLAANQGGNAYLARMRYEYGEKGAWDNKCQGMTVWNRTKSEKASIDRDRTHLDRGEVNSVISTIIDGMNLNDTIYLLRSLKGFWDEKTESCASTHMVRIMLSRLLYDHRVKLSFPKKYIANDLTAICQEINCSISAAQKILKEKNYILCQSDFGKIGMTLASDVLLNISPAAFKAKHASLSDLVKQTPQLQKQISDLLSIKLSQSQQVRFHVLNNTFRMIADRLPFFDTNQICLLLSSIDICQHRYDYKLGSIKTELKINPKILDLTNLEDAIFVLMEMRLLAENLSKKHTSAYTYDLTALSIALTHAFMSSESLQASYLKMKTVWELSQNKDFLALMQASQSSQVECEALLLQEVSD